MVSALVEMSGDPNMKLEFAESFGNQSCIDDGSETLFRVVCINPDVPKYPDF